MGKRKKLKVSIYEGISGGAGSKLAMTSNTVRRMQEKYGVLCDWFAIESKRITDNFTKFHMAIAEAHVKAEERYKTLLAEQPNQVNKIMRDETGMQFHNKESYAKHISKIYADSNRDAISYRFSSEDWLAIRKALGSKSGSLILTYGGDVIAILIGGFKDGSKSE